MTISSATLAAPTGVTAAILSCTPLVGRTVRVSWTATSSTFADGYEVFRSTVSGGSYASIATVSGRTTVTYDDSAVAASTTYYYVVQATKLLWRSLNSNQASVATQSALCL